MLHSVIQVSLLPASPCLSAAVPIHRVTQAAAGGATSGLEVKEPACHLQRSAMHLEAAAVTALIYFDSMWENQLYFCGTSKRFLISHLM